MLNMVTTWPITGPVWKWEWHNVENDKWKKKWRDQAESFYEVYQFIVSEDSRNMEGKTAIT